MNYEDFLKKLIDDEVEGVEREVVGETKAKARRRESMLAGLEDCRGKGPPALALLLRSTSLRMREAYGADSDDYFRLKMRHAKTEWVCQVVSAAMENNAGRRYRGIAPVSATAMRKAEELLGGEPFEFSG